MGKPLKNRIWELDFLRGFLIILMLIDHLMMTVYCFFGPEWYWLSNGAVTGWTQFYKVSAFYINHTAREVIHPIVVLIFIMLCGFSTGFSRSNTKRAIKMAFLAVAISTVSSLIGDETIIIRFGIIHLLTVCVFVWAFVDLITKRFFEDNKKINLIVGISLGILVGGLFMGTVFDKAFENQVANDAFFMVLTNETFDLSPGDFFPILPWAGIFFIAAGLSPYIFKEKKTLLPKLDGKWNKPICFIGRHTLLIYALHIVIIVLLLELLSYFEFTKWLFIDEYFGA